MASESGPQGPDVISEEPEEPEESEEPEVVPEVPSVVLSSEMLPEVTPEVLDDEPAPRPTTEKGDVFEYYGADVRRELRNEPWNFQFFQAVRLLKRSSYWAGVSRPARLPLSPIICRH